MRIYDIIEKKRDSKELSYEELKFFVDGICDHSIPDYQTTALLMAMYLNGLNDEETFSLCKLMTNSGTIINFPEHLKTVDKHSTGGVGDKTSLIIAPIAAACNLTIAKMSGRGLGHTGGTIDKLESIPGFRTDLTAQEFENVYKSTGICICGQTGNMVPADKILYGLRDVTATVGNISLISTSIMSKKLAAGAKNIVLDVKTGQGAFMSSIDQAVQLAKKMVDLGTRSSRNVSALITNMDYPLGYCVGNSIEVIEAIEVLKGNVKGDLYEVAVALATEMVHLAKSKSIDESRKEVLEVLENKNALEKLKDMIQAQDGDTRVIEDYSLFKQPETDLSLISPKQGYIADIKAKTVGVAAMKLGAGRENKKSKIDHSAGIRLLKKQGDKVEKGEKIAIMYTSKDNSHEAFEMLKSAYSYSDVEPDIKKTVFGRVSSTGTEYFG